MNIHILNVNVNMDLMSAAGLDDMLYTGLHCRTQNSI